VTAARWARVRVPGWVGVAVRGVTWGGAGTGCGAVVGGVAGRLLGGKPGPTRDPGRGPTPWADAPAQMVALNPQERVSAYIKAERRTGLGRGIICWDGVSRRKVASLQQNTAPALRLDAERAASYAVDGIRKGTKALLVLGRVVCASIGKRGSASKRSPPLRWRLA
jgi:hypothetical protein